jgi:hypothetical protein
VRVIDVLCAPCLRAGKKRRLARFRLSAEGTVITIAGRAAPSAISPVWRAGPPRVVPASDVLRGRMPVWTGPPGAGKVHMLCGCGHEAQIRRERILAALAVPGVPVIDL